MLGADFLQGAKPRVPEEVTIARWAQSFSRYKQSLSPGPQVC